MPKNGMPRTTPDLGTGTPVHRQYPPGPRLGPATADASPGTPEFAARRERLRLADGERARIEVATPEPRFPIGTPEYAAYEAELKEELGKFARAEEPYPRQPWEAGDDSEHLPDVHELDALRAEADVTPFGPRRDELIAANLLSTYLKARTSTDGPDIHTMHLAGLKAVFELGLAWGHADEREHGGTN